MFAFSAGDFSAGKLIGASVYPILWFGILCLVVSKLRSTYTRIFKLDMNIYHYQNKYAVVANKSKLILGDLLKEMQRSYIITETFMNYLFIIKKFERNWVY